MSEVLAPPRPHWTAVGKLRGGYYTPLPIAQWLCDWAIREVGDKVLEPSCGDGAFLVAAANRFLALGVDRASLAERLTGVEIVPEEARKAQRGLAGLDLVCADDTVWNGDLLRL